MKCIYCGKKTYTVNSRSRSKDTQVWRRRKCSACKAVFTTGERVDTELALRVRKNSRLEPFLREKLLLDVYSSVSHRSTAITDAKQLTETIIQRLIPCKTGIIDTVDIKTAVLHVLKRFDRAAATSYKAHHS